MNGRTAAMLAAKLALSASLLALVLAKVDATAILEVLARADPALVLAWYVLVPTAIALSGWRWQRLTPGLGLGTAMKYSWIGVFFGNVLPGAIAGDVAKGVSLALKDASARSGLAASIVADKLVGMAVLVLFFDLACAVLFAVHGAAAPQMPQLAALALGLTLAGGIGAAAAMALSRQESLPGSAGRIAPRFAAGVAAAARFYRHRPGLLLEASLISAIIHVVNVLAMYIGLRALGVDAGLLFAALVYPVLSVLLFVPVSVSGIGVRDATLAVFFVLFGLPAASGVALSWLALLAILPNVAIGGLIQLVEMYRRQ